MAEGSKFSALTAQQKADMRDAIRGYKVYTAKLEQFTDTRFGGQLNVGKTYLIISLYGNDDFANVGYIESGTPFIATGTTPTKWTNFTLVINCTDSAPIPLIYENTLVGDLVWSYITKGVYRATFSNTFQLDKTILFIDSPSLISNHYFSSLNELSIELQSGNEVYLDSTISLEIRVYD
jgi:hypothetical protein